MHGIYPAAYLARSIGILIQGGSGDFAVTRIKGITVGSPLIAETFKRYGGRTVGNRNLFIAVSVPHKPAASKYMKWQSLAGHHDAPSLVWPLLRIPYKSLRDTRGKTM